jgi:heme exporter protein A
MLTVTQLACLRGERELFSGVSFALENGAWLHVTGENGAGKTSLLRILCGLSPPAAGEIRWQGESIDKLDDAYRGQIAYLGHQTALKDELSARENLEVSSALRGNALARQAGEDVLRQFDLAGCADLPVRFLSQGQKRRAGLAVLSVVNSQLWILDEPYAALDSTAGVRLAAMLNEHIGRGGIAVLTSHQDVRIAAGAGQTLALGA